MLGFFGGLFSAKHYERFSMHTQRARGYRDELEKLLPSTRIKAIKLAADQIARSEFPRLHELRLFWFWISLHVVVSAIGIVLLFWSIRA